ncbi:MAG: aminotransferase [Gammaproteobacteria bacterium]|nr:MAG: aminotransferase [Gammaproteobacteria bacterium]
MTALIDRIRHELIGQGRGLLTVFGLRPLVYADYTASGRSLGFIEDYIQNTVLPWYANTHTTSSATGAQTTAFREQARSEIAKAVNAGDQDQVIFCGSGATAAVDKLLKLLELDRPCDPEQPRPVVFIGPYEHHSNELPWRESAADVVSVCLNARGKLCLEDLAKKLELFSDRPLKVGSFSAASNVTGIKTDVPAVSRLLKQHGALCCWDYAAAAPYTKIDMNAATPLDAVSISPHKFIGGPGTPGILVVKRSVFKRRIPSVPGGGTVSWVSPNGHRYLPAGAEREEGGTPGIVEAIRAGLVFKLQQQVGIEEIEIREHNYATRAMQRLLAHPDIEVLGPADENRLALFSLRIKHDGKDLHYGFVTALMNDLFGIQLRGGCSCAGPYGHYLLGLTPKLSAMIDKASEQGFTAFRPGWVRLNFNYFITEAEFNYLLDALTLVADHGWRMLPYYQHDSKTNTWRYQGIAPKVESLADLDFSQALPNNTVAAPKLGQTLSDAERILRAPRTAQERVFSLNVKPEHESICWFRLPQDVIPLLDH